MRNSSLPSPPTSIDRSNSVKSNSGKSKPRIATTLGAEHEQFLNDVSNTVLGQTSSSYFPLEIKLSLITPEVTTVLKNFNLPKQKDITISSRSMSDAIIPELLEVDPNIKFDYSKFISHPGNLFVKNLSKSKLNHSKLFKFFNSSSKYKSLEELNIFNQNGTTDDEIFAILRFENYLDMEYLLNKKFTTNPFNVNSGHQLYLNKYISRKQRKLILEEVDEFNNFSGLFIENLTLFFPSDFDFSVESLNKFFDKFRIFGNIQMIYFPVNVVPPNPKVNVADFGFINFDVNENSNINVLKCVYYLNNLTFEEFNAFTEKDLQDISNNLEAKPRPSNNNGIHIAIAQHKHNHYLHQYFSSILTVGKDELIVNYADLRFHSALINNFIRYSNYQETNVYVNNFPTMFQNNDLLWEKFWERFGVIKLAKIIKPQFYSKEDQSVGKIGFVFFEDFELALRAIILTNNKLVSYEGLNYLIKSSFAIQKLNKDRRKKSAESLEQVFEFKDYSHEEYHEDDEENYTYGPPMSISPMAPPAMVPHPMGHSYHPMFYVMPPVVPYFPYYMPNNVYSNQ